VSQFPEFEYRQQQLMIEDCAIKDLAHEFGTPLYIYSKKALQQRWQELQNAFSETPFLPCFAVKANSNLAILQLLASWGAGFDIVSIGELERVLQAGGDAAKVMFSGVAKREDEIRRAILAGVGCINVESAYELQQIRTIAADLQMQARVSLRINPDVDPNTHPYISTGLKESKFGIAVERALPLYLELRDDPWVQAVGIDCHIGSQITEKEPFLDAAQHVFTLVAQLEQAGITLKHIDLGGGFGICYDDEQAPPFSDYAAAIQPFFRDTTYQLVLEPGRSIVANAGALITRVEHIKPTESTTFALIDAAMNDLIRPALYKGWHKLLAVTEQPERASKIYDVVGPVCESGDFFAKGRELPELMPSDLLAVMSAGAYAMSMASNYNSRQRPCELLVDGDQVHMIRKRDSLEQLWENEIKLDL